MFISWTLDFIAVSKRVTTDDLFEMIENYVTKDEWYRSFLKTNKGE